MLLHHGHDRCITACHRRHRRRRQVRKIEEMGFDRAAALAALQAAGGDENAALEALLGG